MALYHSPRIVTDGLVLCLDAANVRSYPGSGTSWFDLSGNGNTGTLVNGPTFNSGNGGSIVFDGADDRASLGGGYLVSTTLPFTINMWFNISVRTNGFHRFITFDALDTAGFGVAYRDGAQPSGGYTGIYMTSNSGWARASTGQQLTSNVWRMLTFTYNGNGSTTTSNFSVFLNASQLNLTSTGNEGIPAATPYNLIAARLITSDNQNFPGKISTTSLYNRALSATEISQNYNATRNRFGV